MARHIHIHMPTRDNGWEESKHPRKDDGKFGTGGGSKQENLSPRQAALRESGSPRYAGRTNPQEHKPGDKITVAGKQHTVSKVVGGFIKTEEGGAFQPGQIDKPDAKKDAPPAEKKPTKAELMATAKKTAQLANAGHESYVKAAEAYEAAGMPGEAEDMRALAKKYGHDKGNAPGETQVPKSRHSDEGGAQEGDQRNGGPLKRGETVKLHPDFADGDPSEYEVVSAEEKGRIGISPVEWEGNVRPVETVQGYMIKRPK